MYILLAGISSTCCDWSVMHVLTSTCLVDKLAVPAVTGQLCMCYNWDQMNLCYCSAAVTFTFCELFVFVACIAVVSLGVMFGIIINPRRACAGGLR